MAAEKKDDKKPVKLPRTAKGKKPIYFDSTTDKLLSMVLTLMGELSVMRRAPRREKGRVQNR